MQGECKGHLPGEGREWDEGKEHGRQDGGGKGRNRGGAFGKGGYCFCTKCETKIPHQRGIKCTRVKCPNCGHTMIREELFREKSG